MELAKLLKLCESVRRELLMSEKWNSIEAVAEEVDAFVTRTGRICLDIVEVNSLVGFALDDFLEMLARRLKEEGLVSET